MTIATNGTSAGLETRLFIDGRFVGGAGRRFSVEDPALETEIVSLQEATIAQVDEAVRAARRAFESEAWKDGKFRKQVMERIADLLEKYQDELGDVLVREVGTPRNLLAPLQIGVPIRLFRYYAGLADQDRTTRLGPDGAAAPSESIIRQVPVGVVAAITAYNYPLLLFALKIAPALAAGCTAVVLPSLQTPLATLLLGRILKESGLPDGTVNLVIGGAEIGRSLCEHVEVDKVSFTGSVGVGSLVMQQAAKLIKGVVLELGGKSALIVMPNCDLEANIQNFHIRYLRNAGQGCASPTRILVHESQMARFVELSREYYRTVRVGDPQDPDTIVGPLISEAHRSRVEAYVARAVAAGAKIVAGGGRPNLASGYYMNPTLLADLDNSFEVAREELFGPVAVLMPYHTLEQAVTIANESSLGLAGFVFGPTESAIEIAKRLRTGSVYVNGGGALRMEAPMGGFKQSGIGRE